MAHIARHSTHKAVVNATTEVKFVDGSVSYTSIHRQLAGYCQAAGCGNLSLLYRWIYA